MSLGVRQLEILGAVNGIVLTNVDIVSILRNVQIGAIRNIGEVLILGGSNLDGVAAFPFFIRFIGTSAN